MPKIAIIGAGLAGIACARRLKQEGMPVTVFEKSRGYGGRCATKRWQDCRVDHGAQYFTLRDPGFKDTVQDVCGDQVQSLAAPVLHLESDQLSCPPRYYHMKGNSHLCRDLAQGLEVRFEQTLTPVTAQGEAWQIQDEVYDQVISTAPLPQTLKLFNQTATVDPYVPCLAMLALYQQPPQGKTAELYGMMGSPTDDIAWSACENHKLGRITPGNTVVVVHAGERFSHAHLESQPEEWSALLREQLETLWELPPQNFTAQLTHRWRFARVNQPVSPPSLPSGLHFCGDALGQSRVEAAWLQGVSQAEALLAAL
ncbi:MAG TPA: hypothetical protein DCP71_08255 [Verrucomicrobiales bacterium]|nr:hypothetical protein [Verrucomicrobiales bacterium]